MQTLTYRNEKEANLAVARMAKRMFLNVHFGRVEKGHTWAFKVTWPKKGRPMTWRLKAGYPALYALYRGFFSGYKRRLMLECGVDAISNTVYQFHGVPEMQTQEEQIQEAPPRPLSAILAEGLEEAATKKERAARKRKHKTTVTDYVRKVGEKVKAEKAATPPAEKSSEWKEDIPYHDPNTETRKRRPPVVYQEWVPGETIPDDLPPKTFRSTKELFPSDYEGDDRQFLLCFSQGHIAGVVDPCEWSDGSRSFCCLILNHDLTPLDTVYFDHFSDAQAWALHQPAFDLILTA